MKVWPKGDQFVPGNPLVPGKLGQMVNLTGPQEGGWRGRERCESV